MLATLIRKELQNTLLSPRFPVVFGLASVLIILSFVTGLNEYRTAVQQYDTATRLAAQELREKSSWMGLATRVYRKPDPMQIFVAGVQNDIGRWSSIGAREPVKLRHSVYEDDPIFAMFRFLDVPFIVQVVLSLLAILFTYDAVNGEKESGTLSLVLSNAVPRTTFILAKCAGSWSGMMIPLTVPFAIGLLIVMIDQPPLTADHWQALGLLIAGAVLYGTVFVMLGILSSTLTRRSSASFLLCLTVWMFSVLIIPRLGVLIAGRINPVTPVELLEARQAQYARDRWKTFEQGLSDRWTQRMASVSTLSEPEREAYRQANRAGWMAEEDELRQQMEQEIGEHAHKLQADQRNQRIEQERTAFGLARISPAAAFQHAAITLARAGIDLKDRYEDEIDAYRTRFAGVVRRKRSEAGGPGGVEITMSSEGGFTMKMAREQGTIDTGAIPVFEAPDHTPEFPMVDFGVLTGLSLLAFAASIWRFQRYDVR